MRNKDNQVHVPEYSDVNKENRTTDYLKYLEAIANSKAKQSDIDKLADEVNRSFYGKNKHLFS